MRPSKVPPLYPIADRGALGKTGLAEATRRMCAGGAEWIQLRAKNLQDDEFCAEIEACCAAAEGTGASLWINDRVDLTALFPVAGVHLGQSDLPPSAARKILGDGRWIGRSTHDEAELREAAADPDVDVIAIGPIFATGSKPDHRPVVGLDFIRRARRVTDKPLVAIGGIDAERAGDVLASGADTVAVLGAVCLGGIEANLERLQRAVAN